MVFVTVGTATQEFRRLLETVDSLAGDGKFQGEDVFMQTGRSGFVPRYCKYTQLLSVDEFQEWLKRANVIICHGGCTQLEIVRMGKVPIVMPRLKRYGEHVNDHQLQLVEALAAEGRVIHAHGPEDLLRAIAEARQGNMDAAPPPRSQMVSLVATAIAELMRQ